MAVETGQVALGDRSFVGDRHVFPFRKLQTSSLRNFSALARLWNRCSSASGADQLKSPSGPAMKPSRDSEIE
jgi:hypothetical protein